VFPVAWRISYFSKYEAPNPDRKPLGKVDILNVGSRSLTFSTAGSYPDDHPPLAVTVVCEKDVCSFKGAGFEGSAERTATSLVVMTKQVATDAEAPALVKYRHDMLIKDLAAAWSVDDPRRGGGQAVAPQAAEPRGRKGGSGDDTCIAKCGAVQNACILRCSSSAKSCPSECATKSMECVKDCM
jgi:hypothetical protein